MKTQSRPQWIIRHSSFVIRHSPLRNGPLVKAAAAACLSLAVALTVTAAPKTKPTLATKPVSSTARTAPDFTWIGAGGKTLPGKNFRGQPVVILIAPSADAGDLRKQARRIEDKYLDFAAKKTIFVAAFTGAPPARVQSDVPFVIAENGAAVAANYGVQGKGIAVVVLGPDGNVDFTSAQVEGAQRILDIINNTFQTQAAARTGQGS